MELTTSITLYGEIINIPETFLNWLEYCKELMNRFGFIANYVGVTSESFRSGKIRSLTKIENKIRQAINKGENINYIAVYSLPNNFKLAALDFNISMCIYNNLPPMFVTFTVRRELFKGVNYEDIIGRLKHFIKFKNGEIYDIDIEEFPESYAFKANKDSSYKSLNVQKRF